MSNRKEPLSLITVKTLLAVIIFAGVGTIIVEGGLLIGERGKGIQNNAEEPQQKAINLVKSQKLFFDMEVYESTRSSNLFKEELKNKILAEIKKDSNLNFAYQNNKEEVDKIIETIVNLKTVVSFSAETLDNGNVKVNVFLSPNSTEVEKYSEDNNKVQAYYIVDTKQNKIVDKSVNMGIPSSDLTEKEIMNQIYRDYAPIIFGFLQTKEQAEIGKNEILYFYFPGCPHCKDTEDFLDILELKYNKEIFVKKINIKESNENMELANSYAQSLMKEKELIGVPFIVVGDKYISGWKENKQEELESYVVLAIEKNDTADWKTYRNEKYGFELKYPEKLLLDNKLQVGSIHIKEYEGIYLGEFNNGCSLHIFKTNQSKNADPFNEADTPMKMRKYVITSELGFDNKIYHFGMSVSSHAVDPDDCRSLLNQILSTFKFIEK